MNEDVMNNISTLELIDNFLDELKTDLEDNWKSVTPEQLGLDRRAAAYEMWVSRIGIATQGNTRSLEYYGGFEYIKGEHATRLSDITIWSSDASRVRECLYRALPANEAKWVRDMYDEEDDEG